VLILLRLSKFLSRGNNGKLKFSGDHITREVKRYVIMDKADFKKKPVAAVTLNLHLDADDAVFTMISRESNLFLITNKQILRVRSPDSLDPNLEHDGAPWEQSLYLPHGASDSIVARTIIQTERLLEMFFAKTSDQYRSLSDLSWEMMNSLVSLRFIKSRLEKQINNIVSVIEKDMDKYTKGNSPRPLPIVEYYDIEFRAFANEVRRTLNTISKLFPILARKDFKGGFDKAQQWAEEERGKDSILAQMLKGDQRWIKTWIDIRIAIEHPAKDKFIETLNFSLEANRRIRLPTWRLIHPEHDMARPQNLLVVFGTCIENLLKFYEDLQFVLTDGHLPSSHKIFWEVIPEKNRDPNLPLRYRFEPVFSRIAG
jgi:hypothetical protein